MPYIIVKFNPYELFKQNNISFNVTDLGIVIDKDNWPSNLIYDDSLEDGEEFYEIMQSDTTLSFYVESSIYRIRSLVSRAIHNQNKKYKHSDIYTVECEDQSNVKDNLIRTKTFVYIKEMKD